MRIAIAIETEDDSVSTRLRISVPTVNLRQHGFHVGLTVIIFRIPPVERAQRLIERIGRLLSFCNYTQSELMHEPPF